MIKPPLKNLDSHHQMELSSGATAINEHGGGGHHGCKWYNNSTIIMINNHYILVPQFMCYKESSRKSMITHCGGVYIGNSNQIMLSYARTPCIMIVVMIILIIKINTMHGPPFVTNQMWNMKQMLLVMNYGGFDTVGWEEWTWNNVVRMY